MSGGAGQLGQQHPLGLRRRFCPAQGEDRDPAPPPGQCHQDHHHGVYTQITCTRESSD